MIDLKGFDEQAAPSKGANYRNSAADLPDGDYEFEINNAGLKTTKNAGTPILTMELLVLTAGEHEGMAVERPSFITSQKAFDIVLADCQRLGFDADQWKVANGRPASEEIEKAVRVMPGMRFKGTKKTNGTFHNIYINERLPGDGKPGQIGKEELEAATADPF